MTGTASPSVFAIGALIALSSATAPLQASIIVTTFDGVVEANPPLVAGGTIDALGLFGPAGQDLNGLSVEVTFTTYTSLPSAYSAPFFPNENNLYNASDAIVTINGVSVDIAGTARVPGASFGGYIDRVGPPGFSAGGNSVESRVLALNYGASSALAAGYFLYIDAQISNCCIAFTSDDDYGGPIQHSLQNGDYGLGELFAVHNGRLYHENLSFIPDEVTVTSSGPTPPPSPPPVPGVPEPATWTMLIVGVLGAGVALRRRRKAAYR